MADIEQIRIEIKREIEMAEGAEVDYRSQAAGLRYNALVADTRAECAEQRACAFQRVLDMLAEEASDDAGP